LLLFGVHGGFFFWLPVAWLAGIGLVLAARDDHLSSLALGAFVVAAAEIFVSSAPVDYHGNWSIGARRLLPLTPSIIAFTALALGRALEHTPVDPRSRRTRLTAAAVVLLALVNGIPAATLLRGDVPLTQTELYGAWSPLRPFWRLVDHLGIDLALAPAQAVFVARYGLSPKAYREALTPRYVRDWRSLTFAARDLDLTQPWAAACSTRATPSARGLWVGGPTHAGATLVFTAEWPFATHARFRIHAPSAGTLAVRANTFWGASSAFEEVRYPQGDSDVEVEIPAGAFDSGLCAWVLDASSELAVERIVIEDRTPRVPHG
jgi:hypothetical protein